MTKLLAVVAGIIVLSFTPLCEAKPKKESLLDDYTHRIVYNRICMAQRNDYTMRELWDYSKELIKNNGSLVEIYDDYPPKVKIQINHQNTVAILYESKKIIDRVIHDGNCFPNSLR